MEDEKKLHPSSNLHSHLDYTGNHVQAHVLQASLTSSHAMLDSAWSRKHSELPGGVATISETSTVVDGH
jgi:hypothetical protein